MAQMSPFDTTSHPAAVSRRRFLAAAAALPAACQALLAARPALAEAPDAAFPDAFVREGALVVVPSRGEIIVAADFHTRHRDFEKWLTRSRLVESLRDRDDCYALILGDVVDAKPGDAHAEPDGDSRMVDRIRDIRARLGKAGERLIFIQGNHEREVVRIYEALKKQCGLNPRNRRRLVEALYATENGAYFRQFNFLERITDEQCEFLKALPVAVLMRNGVVATHAGPPRDCRSPRPLINADDRTVEEIVWSRPANIQTGGYTADDLATFLRTMGNARLLIVGHTPLGALPREDVRNGVGVFADRQVILATSYGWEPGEKSYLVLRLDRRYDGFAGLAPGREILRLEQRDADAISQPPAAAARRIQACRTWHSVSSVIPTIR